MPWGGGKQAAVHGDDRPLGHGQTFGTPWERDHGNAWRRPWEHLGNALGMGTHWEHLGNGLTLNRYTVGRCSHIGNALGTG
jgi:hypothetical protein